MNLQNTIFFNFIHKNKYLFGLVISILIFINYNLINWVWGDKFLYKKVVTFNKALSDTLSHFYQNDIITFTIYEINKNTLHDKIEALNLNNNQAFQIQFRTNLNFKEASKVIQKVVDNSSNQVALELKKQLRVIGYNGIIEAKHGSLFNSTKSRLKDELKILRLNFEKILDRHDEQFQIKRNLESLKIQGLKKKLEILNKRGESKNSIITKNYLEQFDVLRNSFVKDYNDHMQYRNVIRALIFDEALSDLSVNPFALYTNEANYCEEIKDKSKSCDDKIEIVKILSRYLAIRFRLTTIKELSRMNIDSKFNLFKESFKNNLHTKNILKLSKLLNNDIMKIEENFSTTKKIAPGKIFILILSVFNSFILGIIFWAILFKLNWKIYFLKY
jgi:hypothetical protein